MHLSVTWRGKREGVRPSKRLSPDVAGFRWTHVFSSFVCTDPSQQAFTRSMSTTETLSFVLVSLFLLWICFAPFLVFLWLTLSKYLFWFTSTCSGTKTLKHRQRTVSHCFYHWLIICIMVIHWFKFVKLSQRT